MDASAFEKLTDRQKQCLRLVASGKRSKSIGAMIGISHLTVNHHIEAAIAKLGAPSRESAAAMLVAHERGGHPEQLTSDLATLAGRPVSAKTGAPATLEDGARSWKSPEFVREEQAPYGATAVAIEDMLRLPLRSAKRPSNELGTFETLIAIGKLLLLLAIGAVAAAAFVETLSQIARQSH